MRSRPVGRRGARLPRSVYGILGITAVLASSGLLSGCKQLSARGARGDYTFQVMDTDTKVTMPAYLVDVRAEGGPEDSIVGLGVDGSIWIPDDRLFPEGSAGGADAMAFSVVPYVGVHPSIGELFRIPIQIGFLIQNLNLDYDRIDERIDWWTIGLQGSLGAELDIFRTDTEALGFFGGATGSAGITTASASTVDAIDEFNTSLVGYGFEGGVRYRFRTVELRVSYLVRRFEHPETDEDSGIGLSGVENEFDGIGVAVGLRF